MVELILPLVCNDASRTAITTVPRLTDDGIDGVADQERQTPEGRAKYDRKVLAVLVLKAQHMPLELQARGECYAISRGLLGLARALSPLLVCATHDCSAICH